MRIDMPAKNFKEPAAMNVDMKTVVLFVLQIMWAFIMWQNSTAQADREYRMRQMETKLLEVQLASSKDTAHNSDIDRRLTNIERDISTLKESVTRALSIPPTIR